MLTQTQPTRSTRQPRRALPSRDEEQALLSGLLADDPRAWRKFNTLYSQMLFRCITRITSRFSSVVSQDDVREIYSTLCVQLLANDKAKLRNFEPERGNKLGSWLGLLATHATYDFLRGRRREPRTEHAVEADTLIAASPDPFDTCATRERGRIVADLVAELSDKDREFVSLYFGEGVEPSDIARRMKISVKTVYSKKHKIQSRLESMLEQRRYAA